MTGYHSEKRFLIFFDELDQFPESVFTTNRQGYSEEGIISTWAFWLIKSTQAWIFFSSASQIII